MTTIGLIGAGAVGQTVGTLLVTAGWCDAVMVASGSGRTAASLVTDLEDMAQVTGSHVRAVHAAPDAMSGCDAIVVCPRAAFTNTATSDVRMAGLAANAPLIAALGRCLSHYQGTVVVVTNPVDVMSRLFAATSGCARVFGVGSHTDSARYRLALARLLDVPVEAVAGHVIGEHGDHAVICASSTTVRGLPVAVPYGRSAPSSSTGPAASTQLSAAPVPAPPEPSRRARARARPGGRGDRTGRSVAGRLVRNPAALHLRHADRVHAPARPGGVRPAPDRRRQAPHRLRTDRRTHRPSRRHVPMTPVPLSAPPPASPRPTARPSPSPATRPP